MKALNVLTTVFVCFSVATVLAQAAALGVVWTRGGLTEDRCVQILAVAHDVDIAEMWNTLQQSAGSNQEQLSYDELLLARAHTNMDLDLREMASDNGWIDVRNLQMMLQVEKDKYADVKQHFDENMARLREGAANSSLQEVQRQLESIEPKLAKDQLLRIFENEQIDPQTREHIVVAMFKNMPLDKRKRILSTFQTDGLEGDQLHQILRQVRLGVPEMTLIRDTQRRLARFKTKN